MSPDLKSARIYIMPNCQDDEVSQIISLVNEFSYLIKKSIAKTAQLKYTPKLHFVYDKLYDQANKIEDILGNIKGHD